MVRLWIRFSDCIQFGSEDSGVLPEVSIVWIGMLVLYVLILRKWLLDKTKFLLPRRKSYQYLDISSYDLKMHCCQSFYWGWTIGWAKSIIWRAQLAKWLLHFHCWKGHETSWDVAALDNFSWRKRTTMTWVHSVDLHFSFVHGGKNCLEYHPPLRVDCNTGQWETHLQMRNKEVCFAYQLLTTSRLAFGCSCLWFCRCMPSNGSMVMDPFPRKLHWNILTVTFAQRLKTVASSCWHMC